MIPYTDYECRLLIDELHRGDKIILPSSIEHAKFMIRVAQDYIDQQHQATLDALKKDYTS